VFCIPICINQHHYLTDGLSFISGTMKHGELTPWIRVSLETLTVFQLVKKLQTQRFITIFTRAYHWSRIQSASSHPISLKPILILSLNLRLGFQSDVVPSGFLFEILCAFLMFSEATISTQTKRQKMLWTRFEKLKEQF